MHLSALVWVEERIIRHHLFMWRALRSLGLGQRVASSRIMEGLY